MTRVVAITPGRGGLWASLDDGAGSVDVPLEDVETSVLLAALRDPAGLAVASLRRSAPRTLGGVMAAVGELIDPGAPVGINAPVADREHTNPLDELRAAGRRTVEGWIAELNRLISDSARLRDGYLREHNDPRPMEQAAKKHLVIRAGGAEARRLDCLRVRDWVYEASSLVEYDDHDAHSDPTRRGGATAGPIGALAVPVAIAAILGGLTLAGFIAYQVRAYAEHSAELELFRENRELLAQCKTEQECAAARQALAESGAALRDEDGAAWPWVLGAAGVVGLALAIARRGADGE